MFFKRRLSSDNPFFTVFTQCVCVRANRMCVRVAKYIGKFHGCGCAWAAATLRMGCVCVVKVRGRNWEERGVSLGCRVGTEVSR